MYYQAKRCTISEHSRQGLAQLVPDRAVRHSKIHRPTGGVRDPSASQEWTRLGAVLSLGLSLPPPV